MHRVADAIEAAVDVPMLHLADATADAVLAAGLDQVARLGARFTMEEDFYVARLARRGLDVVVPDAAFRPRDCTAWPPWTPRWRRRPRRRRPRGSSTPTSRHLTTRDPDWPERAF